MMTMQELTGQYNRERGKILLSKIQTLNINGVARAFGDDKYFTEVHNDWFNWFFSEWKGGEIRQLLAHRGSYKTTVLSLAVAKHILFNPNVRIGVIRSTHTEAVNFLRFVDGHLNSEIILKMFSDIYGREIKNVWSEDKQNQKVIFTRTKKLINGTLDGIGLDKKFTGRHYDILIMDDCVDEQDRYQKEQREKKYRVYSELISNIREPNGLVINCGTYWHKDDANQRLLITQKNIEQRKYPLGTVLPASEEEIAKKKEELKKSLGEALYHANYEVEYFANSELPFSNLKMTNSFNPLEYKKAAIDPAYDGNDSTALSIGYETGGNFYVYGFLWKESISSIFEVIASILQEHRVSECWYEKNADQGMGMTTLKSKITGRSIDFKDYRSTTKKSGRIQGSIGGQWSRIYFVNGEGHSSFVSEIAEWSEIAAHDDAPDSLAKLIDVLGGFERGGILRDFWNG